MQWLTKNWPIKGAALFLALMLYVAVQLQQPVTTSFDVTLNIQMPRGRALVQKPPKVRVQISGKGSQILKLRSLAGDITRRVPDTLTTSTYAIHLDPSEVELALPKGADVRVMEVRPSEITLALDSVARKEVRIVSLVTVTPDSGQVLHGGLSMTPTSVRLVGPEQSLAAIDSVLDTRGSSHQFESTLGEVYALRHLSKSRLRAVFMRRSRFMSRSRSSRARSRFSF